MIDKKLMRAIVLEKREPYLDVLKTISVFFVIVVHISAINFSKTEIHSSTWMACNVYDSIAHFAAPVLFMVSGALFLNPEKEIKIKRLYKHNIFHILTAFVFWSALYSFANTYLEIGAFSREFTHLFFVGFIKGHYHMWFCYAIIACYIITPPLKQLFKNEQTGEYFIGASFTSVFIVNALKLNPTFNFAFKTIYAEAGIAVGGYVCYYALGYYLSCRKDLVKQSIHCMRGGV